MQINVVHMCLILPCARNLSTPANYEICAQLDLAQELLVRQ